MPACVAMVCSQRTAVVIGQACEWDQKRRSMRGRALVNVGTSVRPGTEHMAVSTDDNGHSDGNEGRNDNIDRCSQGMVNVRTDCQRALHESTDHFPLSLERWAEPVLIYVRSMRSLWLHCLLGLELVEIAIEPSRSAELKSHMRESTVRHTYSLNTAMQEC